MWSVKFTCLSILGLSFLLVRCHSVVDSDKTFTSYDPATSPIFHYAFIGSIENAPVHSLECFDRSVIADLKIQSITIHSKGGKNPEDTLEKRQFKYSKNAEKLHYTDYRFDETPSIWSDGFLNFDGNLGTIVFKKNFGIKRTTSTAVRSLDTGLLLLREKSQNRLDTTWIFGKLEHPEKVISKIGNSLYSVEIYLPEGSSTTDIKQVFQSLGFSDQSLLLAEKTVVFVRNQRPVSAFLLNEFYSQISQSKRWEYDKAGNLVLYEEYVGNTATRSISWTYRQDLLPDVMTIDRKQYFYSYE
jgi:hypothetical protein